MSVIKNHSTIPADDHVQPTALFNFLSSAQLTVGQLVDFANNIPAPWVAATATLVHKSIYKDCEPQDDPAVRRRKLVILGALIDRLTFEIERIPSRRGALI